MLIRSCVSVVVQFAFLANQHMTWANFYWRSVLLTILASLPHRLPQTFVCIHIYLFWLSGTWCFGSVFAVISKWWRKKQTHPERIRQMRKMGIKRPTHRSIYFVCMHRRTVDITVPNYIYIFEIEKLPTSVRALN